VAVSDWVYPTIYCIWKEAIFKSGGTGLFRPITPTRRQQLKQMVTWMSVVLDDVIITVLIYS